MSDDLIRGCACGFVHRSGDCRENTPDPKEQDMGEEAYYEEVLAADTGTVTVRGGYGRKAVWLGLAEGNEPEENPDIIVALTPRQQHALLHAVEACRWQIEWRVKKGGGLEYELLDDENEPVLLLTIEPIESTDLLARYRASAWDQQQAGEPEPIWRVTAESPGCAKRALEDWWTLHAFEHGAWAIGED